MILSDLPLSAGENSSRSITLPTVKFLRDSGFIGENNDELFLLLAFQQHCWWELTKNAPT